MIPIFLTRIETQDRFPLEGVCIKNKKPGKVAIVWLHGLSSRFSSGQPLIKELTSLCAKNNFGYFKFNLRGHDKVISGLKRKKFLGSAFERFEDCVLDIKAIIGFASRMGYKKIILAGHSTGSNKALYYVYKTKDKRVKGLMLTSPISDVAVGGQEFGRAGIKRALALAKKLAKTNPLSLMPEKYGIYGAKRFLSLFEAGRSEDIFHYHDKNSKWKELRSIKIPVGVVFGSSEEYAPEGVEKLLKFFELNSRNSLKFSGHIIKNAGHGFKMHEKALSRVIIKWIMSFL